MPQNDKSPLFTSSIEVTSRSTPPDEGVRNDIQPRLQSPFSFDSKDTVYIELIAYLQKGCPADTFKIEVNEDHSLTLRTAYTFINDSGFPQVRYRMFDIDIGDWSEIHSRTKIDISPDIYPQYPFFLVKKAWLADEDCPGIEEYIEQLGGRDKTSFQLNNSPGPVIPKRASSPLPSYSPLVTSSLPSFSPESEPGSKNNDHQSESDLHSHPDDSGRVTTIHINTINMNLSMGHCSHGQQEPNIDILELTDDDGEVEVVSVRPRKKARTK